MGTPIQDIYQMFLVRVNSYNLIKLLPEDREEILKNLLISSIAHVNRISYTDPITLIDDTLDKEYSPIVVDVLALGMMYYWLLPFIFNSDALVNVLNITGYEQYAPSTLLGKLTELKNITLSELEKSVINLTYTPEKIRSWKA